MSASLPSSFHWFARFSLSLWLPAAGFALCVASLLSASVKPLIVRDGQLYLGYFHTEGTADAAGTRHECIMGAGLAVGSLHTGIGWFSDERLVATAQRGELPRQPELAAPAARAVRRPATTAADAAADPAALVAPPPP